MSSRRIFQADVTRLLSFLVKYDIFSFHNDNNTMERLMYSAAFYKDCLENRVNCRDNVYLDWMCKYHKDKPWHDQAITKQQKADLCGRFWNLCLDIRSNGVKTPVVLLEPSVVKDTDFPSKELDGGNRLIISYVCGHLTIPCEISHHMIGIAQKEGIINV